MVENFPGGIGREEKSWGPSVCGKKTLNFFLFLRGGGGVSSRVGLGTGGWFRPLPRGTRQARERGRKGPKEGGCGGEEKRSEGKKGELSGKVIKKYIYIYNIIKE